EVQQFRTLSAGLDALEAARELPSGVMVAASGGTLASFLVSARRVPQLFGVPIVVLAEAVEDSVLRDAFALGADDVIPFACYEEVKRRLQVLDRVDPLRRPPLTAGVVLVAHEEPTRRSIAGRVLRHAGYDVRFAENARDALQIAKEVKLSVAVVEQAFGE